MSNHVYGQIKSLFFWLNKSTLIFICLFIYLFFIRNEEKYIKRRKDTREGRDTREGEEQEKDERSFPQKQKLNKRENTQLQKTKYKEKPQH